MTTAPSSAPNYTSLTIGQLIGLNLVRLYAWCMQLQASGETRAPRDLARMVISTDAMVHSYIRMLASSQLERVGFTFAANAMRTPIWQRTESSVCSRAPLVRTERAQGCRVCSRELNAHIETAQGSDIISLAELSGLLQTAIENFERAETLASHLARVIICALAYLEPAERASRSFGEQTELAFSASSHIATLQEPWPPPVGIPERQRAFENH